ncbi:SRPBCC family protein [Nocardia sp. NPDC056611]|uniref:SRPBCC family protein n=1 Tax=Nocardia sp. NPDC056611 TaxID=3345877 RepID=UPI00366F5D26
MMDRRQLLGMFAAGTALALTGRAVANSAPPEWGPDLSNPPGSGLAQPALQGSVSRVIAAPRHDLYVYISEMTHMREISPENQWTKWVVPGERFEGYNAIGLFYQWPMGGVVTENVPDEMFDFYTDAPSQTHWRYAFTDVEGGTLVTESFRKQDPQIAPIVFMQDISGAHDRQAHLTNGMRVTLERLAEKFESPR